MKCSWHILNSFQQWFNNYTHHEMLATINILQYYQLYSLRCIFYPCDLFSLKLEVCMFSFPSFISDYKWEKSGLERLITLLKVTKLRKTTNFMFPSSWFNASSLYYAKPLCSWGEKKESSDWHTSYFPKWSSSWLLSIWIRIVALKME